MPKTFGPYSPIKQAGATYYLAGQLGVDDAKAAPADIQDQTHLALQNMRQLLATQGLTMDQVVKTTIFVKNISDFAAVNQVYVEYFNEPRPARSCVEVANLPQVASNQVPILVEIEAIAYREPS